MNYPLTCILFLLMSGLLRAADPPRLAILPIRGNQAASSLLDLVERASFLELQQSDLFQVLTREEIAARTRTEESEFLPECLTGSCRKRLARTLGCALLASARIERHDTQNRIQVSLYDGSDGSLIETAAYSSHATEPQALFNLTRYAWRDLLGIAQDSPYPLRRDTLDDRAFPTHWAAGLSLLGGGFAAAAWILGNHFLTRDNNALDTGYALTGLITGSLSGIRGFYGGLPSSARIRGMAGAGVAMDGAWGADLINPAGLIGLSRQELALSTATLAGGGNQLAVLWAAPWSSGIYWAHSAHFSGDALSGELTLQSDFAYDWSFFSSWLTGMASAVSFKGYALQAGNSGTGVAHSTGSGLGAGLNVSAQWMLSSSIRLGLMIEDLASSIQFQNTLTGQSYRENIPTRLTGGIAWRTERAHFYLDWRKAILRGQRDQVLFGSEYPLAEFLVIRGGISQIAGSDIRLWSAGASLRATRNQTGMRLNYAWESGEKPYDMLGSRQILTINLEF